MVLISKDKKAKISLIRKLSKEMYGALVKGVIDIKQKIMIIGGELHADGESILLKQGSTQNNLWGINLYPDKYPDKDWIEIDSIINLRPSQGNFSRTVKDNKIRDKIFRITNDLVEDETP